MPQNESLSIKVTENGASHVADMFEKIATEANKAAEAVAAMRKQVGGKGTIKEAKGAKGGKDKAVAEAKKAEKEIEKAKLAAIKKAEAEEVRAVKKLEKVRLAAEESYYKERYNDIKQLEASDLAAVQREKKARLAAEESYYKERYNDIKQLEAADLNSIQREKAARLAAEESYYKERYNDIKQLEAADTKSAKRVAAAKKSAQKHVDGIRTRHFAKVANEEARALDRATKAANRNAVSMRKLGGAVEKNTGGIRALGNSVYFAQRAFAALGGVMILRGYLAMTDAYQNMNNRLKLVTTSASHLGSVQQELFAIAKNTRQSVKDTVETYVRLNLSLKNAGVSQKRLMGVMSTLNKMLAVSGASAIEASQSIRQLSQAFSKGKLDGDEFRSVSEAMPSILTALEQSLGKTRGELRDMSEAGMITGEVLLDAFEAVKTSVDQDFSSSIVTLGQAWTVLKDEVLKAVGSFNTASGAGGLLVKAVMLLADNLWVVVAALKVAFYWLMFKMTAALVTATLKTAIWATTLNASLIPAMLNTVKMLRFGFAKFGILKTAALGGAAAMGTFAAAAAAAVFVGYKLVKWITSAGPALNKFDKEIKKNNKSIEELKKTIEHMRRIDPTDERIKKLEEEIGLLEKKNVLEGKDKLIAGAIAEAAAMDKKLTDGMFRARQKIAQLQHEISTGFTSDMHDAPGGGPRAEKTTRNKSAIQEAINLAKEELEVIKEKISLRKAEEEAKNAAAKEAELVNDLKISYKKLQAEINATGDKMREYLKGVDLLETLHRKEIITMDAMLHGLRRLKNAYSDLHPEMAAVKVLKDTKEDIEAAEAARELAKAQGLKGKAIKEAGEEAKIVSKESREFFEKGLAQVEGLPEDQFRVAVDKMLKGRKVYLAARAETRKLLKADSDKKKKGSKPKVDDSLAAFVASMNPVFAATRRLSEATTMLNDAWNRGLPITEEVNAAYEELQKRTKAARLPTEHLVGLMDDMIATQHLSTEALEKLNAETAERDRLLATGATEEAVKAYMELTKVINEQRKAREANGRAALLETPPDFAEGHSSRKFYKQQADLAQATTVQDQNRLLINHKLIEARRELQQAQQDGNISIEDYRVLTAAATEEARRATRATELWGGALQGVIAQLSDAVIEDMWIGAVTTAYMALEDAMVKGIIQVETALFDMMTGATTDWDNFTESMKDLFHDAAEAILEDITRILVRMASMKVVDAALSIGGEGNLEGDVEKSKGPSPEEAKDAAALLALEAKIAQAQAAAIQSEASAVQTATTASLVAAEQSAFMTTFGAAASAAISGAQAAAAQAGIAAAAAQAALATMQAKEGVGAISDIATAAAKRHGGTINTANLPRFAMGGSMQVGGSGGPDTKLVQFMASPGENVHVTNPGQSRLDNRQAAPAAPPVVNVNNFSDPNEIPAAMASSTGERVILNTIQNNAEMLSRMLK